MLEAIMLGIVQGLTEFLPVSSSGHLIVASWLMDGKPLPLALNLALHVGTLVALLAYFWKDWLAMGTKAVARVVKRERSFEADVLLPALILGTIPAGIVGVLWEDDIERIFHHPSMVALPLAVVGIALWAADRLSRGAEPLEGVTLKKALLVGLAQACALMPGVSRSGSTILAGRAVGLDRGAAARFSFLLGTPATAGAVVLKSKEIIAHLGDAHFYLGMLTSALVGCLAIHYLLQFLRRFGFGAFALYRVALAAVIVVLVSA